VLAKAIIPAAGRGTRVAGIRGDTPKECLEICGLPMITWALVELALSGVREVAVVVSPTKPALVDLLNDLPPFPDPFALAPVYGTSAVELSPPGWPRVHIFEQTEARGVIDALARAHPYLEGEPFGLMMPDNLFVGPRPPIGVLSEVHARVGSPILGLVEISREHAARTGNCGRVTLETAADGAHHIRELHDKGAGAFRLPEGATTGVRAVGRSIVPADFARLDGWPDDARRLDVSGGREIDDVPRFQALARKGTLLGVVLDVQLHDLGQESGILAARDHLDGPVRG